MLKLLVGIFLLATLLSGCANQKLQTSLFGPVQTNAVKKAADAPPQVAKPALQKPKKKKRLAAYARLQQEARQPPRLPERNPAAPRADEPEKKELVSLNEPKLNCKTPVPELPEDADRRSATAGVQCFFLGRGEYLTNTGAVKPLP